jgi:hypothetical protein
MEEAGRYYAIANLLTLEERGDFAHKAEPMDYSGEDSTARRVRRAARWTPVAAPA